MAVGSILSIEVQELIARVSQRIFETDEIVAITRALVRETRHIIRPRIAASESDSLSYENDWGAPAITAHCEPVQS